MIIDLIRPTSFVAITISGFPDAVVAILSGCVTQPASRRMPTSDMSGSAFMGMVKNDLLPNVKDEPRAAGGRAVFLGLTRCGGAEAAWAKSRPNQRVGSGGWFGSLFFTVSALEKT